jgi:hypothetical protein
LDDKAARGSLEPASSDAQRAMVCTSRVARAPGHYQSLVSKYGKETASVPSLTFFRNAVADGRTCGLLRRPTALLLPYSS